MPLMPAADNAAITDDSPFRAPALVAWREPIERRVLSAAGMRGVVLVSGVAYGDGGGGLPGLLLGSPRDDAGNLVMLGTGQQHWATVHAADLADAFRRALENDAARGYYVIGKVHHALADGVASVNLMARAMDLKDGPTDERDNDEPGVTPSVAELLRAAARDHARQVAELPGLIKDAATGMARVRRRTRERGDHPDLADAFDAPPTFLNHVVSPRRWFASATLPLADAKATAKALGITVNDVLLTVTAGGLRTLLLDYDGHAERPIIASVPTATDKSDRITGNEISGLSISLPVHIGDPVERARLVALATRIAKEDHEILGPRLYGRLMAYLPTAVAPAAFRWLGRRDAPNKMMNVAVSSVVGPRERGHFGGAAVSEIYSTGVLSPGAPVNITIWSYVDALGVAVLTDDQTVKDAHEATDALTASFMELRSAAGIPV